MIDRKKTYSAPPTNKKHKQIRGFKSQSVKGEEERAQNVFQKLKRI